MTDSGEEFGLTRDETLVLVFDKLMLIKGEVEECELHGEWVREAAEIVGADEPRPRVKLRDVPGDWKRRLKHIKLEADRAIKLIEHHERVRTVLPHSPDERKVLGE